MAVLLFFGISIVGDGFPVPKPDDYECADRDAKTSHSTAGTGNPSPTWETMDDRRMEPAPSQKFKKIGGRQLDLSVL